MKIAFIVNSFPKLSETFILNQITGLLDLGHDVKIVANFNPHERKQHSDIKKYKLMERVYYLNTNHNKTLRIFKAVFLFLTIFHKNPFIILKSRNVFKHGKMALYLKSFFLLIPFLKETFDIIHCHFGQNGIIGLYLKEVGIPGKYITSFHGFDITAYPKMWAEPVYNNLFKKGDLFTANTNFIKQQLLSLGCNENKIKILPVGLKIERFNITNKKLCSDESIIILTVARLVENKGHEYAIKAIARIAPVYPNIRYLIAGDGPLKKNLEELALMLKIENQVKFLGEVNQDEVIVLYQSSHIFLLPSITSSRGDQEGQGLVLQEAQAAGLPVVSTYSGGIAEGVCDGQSGFLVPEKDVDALTDKIIYLIKHPALWTVMGRHGRAFVEKNYDIKNLNQTLLAIYQEIVNVSYNKFN